MQFSYFTDADLATPGLYWDVGSLHTAGLVGYFGLMGFWLFGKVLLRLINGKGDVQGNVQPTFQERWQDIADRSLPSQMMY